MYRKCTVLSSDGRLGYLKQFADLLKLFKDNSELLSTRFVFQVLVPHPTSNGSNAVLILSAAPWPHSRVVTLLSPA